MVVTLRLTKTRYPFLKKDLYFYVHKEQKIWIADAVEFYLRVCVPKRRQLEAEIVSHLVAMAESLVDTNEELAFTMQHNKRFLESVVDLEKITTFQS